MYDTPLFKSRDTIYHRIEDGHDGEKSDTSDQSLSHGGPKIQLSSGFSPWMLSTILFASATVFFAFYPRTSPTNSFERGFLTDLEQAKAQISIHQVRFTGSPSFTESGDEFVPDVLGATKYVGEPSPAVDEAWRVLSADRYFLLTEDEAREAWGPGYAEFWNEQWGGYLTAFDMFHTLHCLDHLRQAFYPEYYPQTAIHGKLHNEHCIDHLRQMVMCNGDMTPIPSRYYPGIQQNYIDSDRTHTCRNFQELRAWTSERHNGSSAIAPFEFTQHSHRDNERR